MKAFILATFIALGGLAQTAPTDVTKTLPEGHVLLSDLIAAQNGTENETHLNKRFDYSFYMCEHVNWQGACQRVGVGNADGVCIRMDAPRYDWISSFGPNANTQCTVYAGRGCSLSEPRIDFVVEPGWGDLGREVRPYGSTGTPPHGNWNDAIDSVRCWKRWE